MNTNAIKRWILTALAALMSLAILTGCERKDVQEAVDGDDAGVLEESADNLDVLSPQPEEAGDELPGVEPGQVQDASLTE